MAHYDLADEIRPGMVVYCQTPMPCRLWRRSHRCRLEGHSQYHLEIIERYLPLTWALRKHRKKGPLISLRVLDHRPPYVRLLHQDKISRVLVVDTREVNILTKRS